MKFDSICRRPGIISRCTATCLALILGAGCASSVGHLKDESLSKSSTPQHGATSLPSDYRAYVAFLKATDLDRVGETKEAEKWFKKAIDYDPGAPTPYLRYARVLAEQQSFDDALEATHTAIAVDPDNYEAHLQLGDLLQIASRFDEAEQAYEETIALDPSREDAYLALAYLYRVQDSPEKGVEVLARLRKINGALSPRTTLLEAALYKDLGERDKAEADFLFVLDEYPELRQAQKGLFDLYFLDGDLKAAAQKLETVYQERPYLDWIPQTLVQIYAKLGDVDAINHHLEAATESDPEMAERMRLDAVDELANRHAYDKAMSVLRPMLDRGTDNAWALFYAGYLFAEQGDKEKAIEMYGKIPVSSELYPNALQNRALVLNEMGRTGDAIALLKGYLDQEPDADDVKYTLIGLYTQDKQYDKAMEEIEKILKQRPNEPRAIVQEAFVLEDTGRVEDAVSLLKKHIETRKDYTRYYEALALILADDDRLHEAIDVLNDAIKVAPDNISLRFSLGSYYSRLDMNDEAIAQMRKILELDENNSEALNFIGYTWAELGIRLDEAETLIERALELDPENGYITDSLGWVYYQKGDYERAVTTLERAVQLITREPIIVEHLGDAYLKTGQKEKALEAYRRAAREVLEEDRPDPKDVTRITSKRDKLERELSNGTNDSNAGSSGQNRTQNDGTP